MSTTPPEDVLSDRFSGKPKPLEAIVSEVEYLKEWKARDPEGYSKAFAGLVAERIKRALRDPELSDIEPRG